MGNKKLIINADDFGIHDVVNEAVYEAYKHGILTSTSLMASGPSFEEAVRLAKEMPHIGIGIHLTLVGSLPTVLPPDRIPSLTWQDGMFCHDYMDLLKRDMLGKVSLQEVYDEWDAQIKKIMSTGLPVTHIDGHQHLHMWNHFFPITLRLAEKYHIPCMRVPDENMFFDVRISNLMRSLARDGLTFMARLHRKKLSESHIITNDHFYGMLYGGHLYPGRMMKILRHLEPGTTEIMCHPSSDENAIEQIYHWAYHGETADFKSLMSPEAADFIKQNNIKLISYRDLIQDTK